MHDLTRELGFPNAAHTSQRQRRSRHDGITQVLGHLAQRILPPDKSGVGAERHHRAGGKRCYRGDLVERNSGSLDLSCCERVRVNGTRHDRLVDIDRCGTTAANLSIVVTGNRLVCWILLSHDLSIGSR